MNAAPLFSVVVPTCDRNDLLAKCLERLAPGRQTLAADAYDVVVSDDGRDQLAKTMIAQRFPGVRWTRGPRRGPAANRNHGARFARGSWLAFTDDDCVPDPEWLAAFAKAIAQREGEGVLEGRTCSAKEESGPFMRAPVNETGGMLWSCNLAVRAEVFRELRGFDENFPAAHLEDVDFRLRARQAGCTVKFVPAALVFHPPRRIGPVLKQVRDHRAYFYLARKHRLSLAAAGLSGAAFVRGRLAELRRSRSGFEALRFGARCAVEAALLLPRCAWWAIRRDAAPPAKKIVCINSTVPVRRRMSPDGQISSLHHWGYEPRAGDVPLAHRINRLEITLRATLGGTDPNVLLRTWWHLWRGADGVYAVTQPDIWRALPSLRRWFPSRRFVTWAWTASEVDRYFTQLQACDHVLCLTEDAKHRLDERGLADRSSLAIWGCDPAHYHPAVDVPCDLDVLIAGLTARDVELIRSALALKRFSVCLLPSSRAALALGAGADSGVMCAQLSSESELVAAFHRCRVTWIPLRENDPYPSGYTNLVESLLCGTAVVIADASIIPRRVLALPGVFRYRTGSLEDFVRCTDEAIAFMGESSARARVAAAAAQCLDGAALTRTIREELGVG